MRQQKTETAIENCFTCGARCRRVYTREGSILEALPGEKAQTLSADLKECFRCGAPNATRTMAPPTNEETLNG